MIRRLAGHARLRGRVVPRPEVARSRVADLIDAWQRADEVAIAALCRRTAVLLCDRGVDPFVVRGSGEIAAVLIRFLRAQPGAVLTPAHVNGAPGVAVHVGGRTVAVMPVDVRLDGIAEGWLIADPARLSDWDR